ncbi:chlorophyllase-2-like [Dioscorea cayenensis subsp. rotundata]|uniref:Chlorophyllase-2-like n=1 Tax=Dioscorea cayennensis subsp. rotundata TaxID=55577 RepID=A0AB40C7T0_DIOCR|nr:chlorophyllase-2-like [Dioscorea cayenensis subsp. rotundata]
MESKKNVFEMGKLKAQEITIKKGCSSPPKSLLIVTPSESGKYPVVLFLHGFLLSNNYYSLLLNHISSHGFILVAPQLSVILPCSTRDITGAAKVTDWLAGNLQALLPTGVEANLQELALAGHSRGGHAAFSLILGCTKTTLKFSALIGVDPVAGPFKGYQIPPRILTGKPSSMELGIPAMVIGTGLGEKKKMFFPACAPEGVNHKEFYYECKPPCYHVVVKDYGHLDMLDDDAPKVTKCVCTNGVNCKDLMRRSTGGIMVAFLKAYLMEDNESLEAIFDGSLVAPAELSPVERRLE